MLHNATGIGFSVAQRQAAAVSPSVQLVLYKIDKIKKLCHDNYRMCTMNLPQPLLGTAIFHRPLLAMI